MMRSSQRRLIIAFTLLAFSSCGESPTTTPPAPPAARPTTVEVTPAASELTAIGASVQLNVRILDQRGQPMTGLTVTWATDDAAIAIVDSTGLVTAVRNGSASITATVETASGGL